VSPQGGRQASGKGGGRSASKQPSDGAAGRRRGLVLFGAVFLILFVVVAMAEGLGDPSIPSGDIVVIEDAPGDVGNISKADLDHALELAAKGEGQKKVPKPGTPKYDELKEAALSSLLEFAWLRGQADEMGIAPTDVEVSEELKKLKDENFQAEAEFQEFVKQSGYTPKDIDERVEYTLVTKDIQEDFSENAPTPSQSEVEDYYEASKATQFTQPASHDVRLIRNQDRQKAEQALAQLEEGNTAKDWNRVAQKYSEDPATKGKGGLQQNVAEGVLEEPVNAALSSTPEGQLAGPIQASQGFYVIEVQNSTPESVQGLKSVEGQIESALSQQLEQEEFSEFIADFNARWASRTFCAEDYLTQRCANFEGSGRPASAPPACYEADPDGGRPEACPAPVFQLVPALPGSVTPLAPRGNPLAQRPVPAGEPSPAGAEEAAGLPGGGAVPPPAEAPSE
jgi:parvulin-like peptidyl-prolyl isomerase